jgi:hypothetical protein
VILNNWLRRYRAGAALCRFCPRSWNRIANVLESIEGVGCRIEKTENGWGWQIVVGDGSDTETPPGLEAGGYPFGPQYPWGIKIAGAVVTVYAQIFYRGGVPKTCAQKNVTITTDGDWVVLRFRPADTPGAVSLTLDRWPAADGTPADKDGYVYRGLHKFAFANGVATWQKAGWVGGDLSVMGY